MVILFRATLAVDPIPKGRPRVGNGHTFTPKRTRQAERKLADLLLEHGAETNTDDELGIRLVFRTRTARRVDIDNLTKLVLDAANGILWRDDSQVVWLESRLFRKATPPGIDIIMWVAQ